MRELLGILKSDFANHASITALVSGKCSFLMELQRTTPPFITYNLQEIEPPDKDGTRDFVLIVFIISDSLDELMNIYEASRTVLLDDGFGAMAHFNGSTFPESERELDGNFIIELTFNINL